MDEMKLSRLQAELISSWYEANRRPLPWRDTGNPYDVWLSEIMLQQTRIEAVKERFIQFRKELPDIPSVAACEDDRLMRLWEGLGYYSRAKNLKKCAQVLCEKYGGSFPEDAKLLQSLPGIGPYTAGAIASIAFEKPVPAVDGNVMRVISRLFLIRDDIRLDETKRKTENILMPALMEEGIRPSLLNQGLMEIGEVICVPNAAPRCSVCPLKDTCMAHAQNLTAEIPYRSPLKNRKIQERTILVIRDGSRFLMNRRPKTGLLASLYEFIGTDGFLSAKQAEEYVSSLGLSPLRIRPLPDSRHVFTHLEWHMKAYEILVADASDFRADSMFLATEKELQSLAVPSAFRTYTDWYSLR